jgi:hypothetical protein
MITPEPIALTAPTPGEWLAVHLDGHLAARFDDGNDPDARSALGAGWCGLAELLDDDAAVIRSRHARLVANGVPARAAATYLADWDAGIVAGAVGYALATAHAGFCAERTQLRFRRHPGGWFDRVELGRPEVLVPRGHPWTGQPGVAVAEVGEVLARTVAALVEAVSPIVEACYRLARVGRTGLWNEVGDALGMALAHRRGRRVPVTPAMVAVLEHAVAVPGAPWRATPKLRFAESSLGLVHVAQKGGCCLAYTRPRTQPPDLEELDEDRRAYLERFPVVPEAPPYCATCSFRDTADCDARQVFWMERAAAGTTRDAQPQRTGPPGP